MKNSIKTLFIVCLLMIVGTKLNAQNLITNGGFETGASCGGTVLPQNWTRRSGVSHLYGAGCTDASFNIPMTSLGGICNLNSVYTQNYPVGGIMPPTNLSNSHFIGLFWEFGGASTGAVQQTLATPLLAGRSYIIRFSARAVGGCDMSDPNYATLGQRIAVAASPTTLAATPANPLVGTVVSARTPITNTWTTYTLCLTIPGTQNLSNFVITNENIINTKNNNYTIIDDISIEAAVAPTLTVAQISCGQAKITCTNPSVGNFDWYNTTAVMPIATGTTNAVTVTSSGTYQVIATPSVGCSMTASVAVTMPAPFTVSITKNRNLGCYPNATLTAASATATNYSWYFGGTGAVKTVTTAGTYTVVAANALGCSATATIAVTSNTNPPAATLSKNRDLGCNTSVVLTASATPISGVTFAYLWSGGGTAPTKTITAAGIYTVTITNSSTGCTTSRLITLTSTTTPPVINISGNSFTCNGSTTVLTVNGLDLNTYVWSNTLTTTSVNVAGGAIYTVTATGANGCTARTDIAVSNTVVTAAITGTATSCGNVSLTASGGTHYLWSGGNSAAFATNTFQQSGIYTVTVTGTNNCMATATSTVNITGNFAANITGIRSDVSGDACALSLSQTGGVSVTGGTAPYTYLWTASFPITNATTASPTINLNTAANGAYTLTLKVTDAANCTFTTNIAIRKDCGGTPIVSNICSPLTAFNLSVTGNIVTVNTSGFAANSFYSWNIVKTVPSDPVAVPNPCAPVIDPITGASIPIVFTVPNNYQYITGNFVVGSTINNSNTYNGLTDGVYTTFVRVTEQLVDGTLCTHDGRITFGIGACSYLSPIINGRTANPNTGNSPETPLYFSKTPSIHIGAISLYPNPASTECTVAYSVKEEEIEGLTLQVFDLLGKEVINQRLTVAEASVVLNTSDLISGLYLVKISNKQVNLTRKVSIIHE